MSILVTAVFYVTCFLSTQPALLLLIFRCAALLYCWNDYPKQCVTQNLYNLGTTGLIGLSKVLAPLVFNFLRYTLSPYETYSILKSRPPKQTLEGLNAESGNGNIAFTRPS